MSSRQKLTLIGYLGKDPETRYTPSGTAVTTFSVATTEKWKDKQSGQQKERTTWHYCEAWGRTAEVAAEYLTKGDQVYVEGKIRQEEWEKDGQTQRMTKVRVDQIMFLKTTAGGTAPASAAQSSAPADPKPEDFEDDIPF